MSEHRTSHEKPQEYEMREYDLLDIHIPRYPQASEDALAGQFLVAELDLGNAEETVQLLKITDAKADDYLAGAQLRAEKYGIIDPEYFIAVIDKNKAVKSMAFMQPRSAREVLGREGTLKWISHISDQKAPNPFEDNTTVSRQQVMIVPGNEKVSLLGVSKNSRTNVKTTLDAESTPRLPKVTPEDDLVGFNEGDRRSVVAIPVGEITVSDALGENSSQLDVSLEGGAQVDGNGIFDVESDGTFVSPDGQKEYNPASGEWVDRA